MSNKAKYGITHAPRIVFNSVRKGFLCIIKRGNSGPRLIANSIPKSGTHLLMQTLAAVPELALFHDGVLFYGDRLGNRRHANRFWLNHMGGGCFAMAHIPYRKMVGEMVEKTGLKTILLVRDPRDVVVSQVRFISENAHLKHHDKFKKMPNDEARMRNVFYGENKDGIPGFKKGYRWFLDWLDHGSLLVRFEDLRGLPEIRRQTCRRILRHIDLEPSEKTIDLMLQALKRKKSRTFREGATRGFEKAMPAQLISEINTAMADILRELDYDV